MKTSTIATLLAGLVLLVGCDMMVAPWRISSYKETARRPVTCAAGTDCDQKWARAVAWVKKSTILPIATQTSSLIKTADSPNLTPDPAITVTKIATADPSVYVLQLQADCGDDFGCVPPLLKLKASFVTSVMGNQ